MKKNQYGLRSETPFFMSVPALLWQFLFLYVPLISIVALSFLRFSQGLVSFSLHHYQSLFKEMYWLIIGRSMLLAFSTATICLIAAYPIVYWLIFRVREYKNIFLFFLIVPFWTSLLVQAYSWFFVLEKNGLINMLLTKLGIIAEPLHLLDTPFAIHLVMVYCYLPFMILPLYNAMEKLDLRLIEASMDLGANQFQTFLRISLPLSLQGIKTGFFLVFVPSFGEFVIPALLGGGKRFYIGSLIEHFFLVSRDICAGAAFTCLCGAILLGLMVMVRWLFDKILR